MGPWDGENLIWQMETRCSLNLLNILPTKSPKVLIIYMLVLVWWHFQHVHWRPDHLLPSHAEWQSCPIKWRLYITDHTANVHVQAEAKHYIRIRHISQFVSETKQPSPLYTEQNCNVCQRWEQSIVTFVTVCVHGPCCPPVFLWFMGSSHQSALSFIHAASPPLPQIENRSNTQNVWYRRPEGR